MRILTAIILYSAASLANAETVVLDFESNSGQFSTPIYEDGFTIDPALAPGVPALYSGNTGKAVTFCGWCNPTEGISIYNTAGDSFELDSFDTFTRNTGYIYDGVATGYLQGGGTVSRAFDTSMGTLLFDQSWVNLTSVDFVFTTGRTETDFTVPAIDNVVLQAVPVPAAVWLFGSALAGLGWLRRR